MSRGVVHPLVNVQLVQDGLQLGALCESTGERGSVLASDEKAVEIQSKHT